VGRKCQSRSHNVALTSPVIGILANLELFTRLEVTRVRDFGDVPCSEAQRVTVVCALDIGIGFLGEKSMKVQFLTRIVGVDVGSGSIDVIRAVFNAEYASRDWMLSNTDGVTQAPA